METSLTQQSVDSFRVCNLHVPNAKEKKRSVNKTILFLRSTTSLETICIAGGPSSLLEKKPTIHESVMRCMTREEP